MRENTLEFLQSELAVALRDALSAGDEAEIERWVADMCSLVWSGQLGSPPIQEAVDLLQRSTHFAHAITIADAAIAVGRASVGTRRRYCQALIEVGALHAAELELRQLAETYLDAREHGEVAGLRGRVSKQRYVRAGRESDLQAAIAAYRAGYDGGTDRLWHGSNLVALLRRAERDGLMIPDAIEAVEALAGEVLSMSQPDDAVDRAFWRRAGALESLLALGRRHEAAAIAETIAEAPSADAFELDSLRRQLQEIWQLAPDDRVMLAVTDQLLAVGRNVNLALPESAQQFEKVFSAAVGLGYGNLSKGLGCAESVCKITDSTGEAWGTGFLLSGRYVSDALGDDLVLVTNAHVVSPDAGVGALVPEQAEARFDVTTDADGRPLVITGLTPIWSSPPDRCDVTLLRFGGRPPQLNHRLQAAAAMQSVTPGAYVNVVGHPAGGGLKFSIRGNDLLAYDASETKVHYLAPTEGGSSGSPVFTQAWDLMAVHHSGSAKMRRLDDPTQTYEANEGITLSSIRADYLANPPTG